MRFLIKIFLDSFDLNFRFYTSFLASNLNVLLKENEENGKYKKLVEKIAESVARNSFSGPLICGSFDFFTALGLADICTFTYKLSFAAHL